MVLKCKKQKRSPRNLIQDEKLQDKNIRSMTFFFFSLNEVFPDESVRPFLPTWQVWCVLKVKLRRQRYLEKSRNRSYPNPPLNSEPEYIFLNLLPFRIFQILRTLPLSRSSWHLLRQSGLLVNSTKAFSAWSRVVVSVVSYSCLHRFSSWARLWKRSVKKEISRAYYRYKVLCSKLLDKDK